MSFKNYLVNLAKDAALGIYGAMGLIGGFGMMLFGESVLAGAFFLVTGLLALLYTRYRKKEQGITY